MTVPATLLGAKQSRFVLISFKGKLEGGPWAGAGAAFKQDGQDEAGTRIFSCFLLEENKRETGPSAHERPRPGRRGRTGPRPGTGPSSSRPVPVPGPARRLLTWWPPPPPAAAATPSASRRAREPVAAGGRSRTLGPTGPAVPQRHPPAAITGQQLTRSSSGGGGGSCAGHGGSGGEASRELPRPSQHGGTAAPAGSAMLGVAAWPAPRFVGEGCGGKRC